MKKISRKFFASPIPGLRLRPAFGCPKTILSFLSRSPAGVRRKDASNKKIALLSLLSVPLFSIVSLNAFAKPQTVTLELPTMNCVTCPFTVKKALHNVDGVSKAEVIFKNKLAVVTFDDEKTTVKALTEATRNAGYPSTVQE